MDYLKFIKTCIQECEEKINDYKAYLHEGVVTFDEIKARKDLLEVWQEELIELKQTEKKLESRQLAIRTQSEVRRE